MSIRRPSALVAALALTSCAYIAPPPPEQPAPPVQPEAQAQPVTQHVHASPYQFSDTLGRLKAGLRSRGLSVFAVIDHGASAQSAGLELEPATVVVFGHPKAGTVLMQRDILMGLDLPLTMLVYQKDGSVYLAYDDIQATAAQRGLDPVQMPLPKMAEILSGLAEEVTLSAGKQWQQTGK